MTPELTVLTYVALLQVLQFVWMSLTVNLDIGVKRTASARDLSRLGKPLQELLNDKSGRLLRAFNNHFEGLILFTIATPQADRLTALFAAMGMCKMTACMSHRGAKNTSQPPTKHPKGPLSPLANTLC